MEKKLTINSPIKFSAEAAGANPAIGWMEFVLTDDQPNVNNQGISKEAFASIIDSGLYMPLKMAVGEIADGHENAMPLGAIVNLEATETTVVGKSSIWKDERPNDYELLVAATASETPPHISWEVLYTTSEVDADGVEWIKDPILVAAAIVGMPAYEERTPVTVVSASAASSQEDVPEAEVPEPDEETTDPEEELPTNEELLKTLEEELDTLRQYKEQREKEDSEAEIYSRRIEDLTQAGIELSQEELEQNKAAWVTMDDTTFAMVVSLLKAKGTSSTEASVQVPDLSGEGSVSPLEVVRRGLTEMKNK